MPISLLLLELLFFPGSKRHLILAGGIAATGVGIVWIILAYLFQQNPFSLEAMEALTRETTMISRTSYLATQMIARLLHSEAIWAFMGHFLLLSLAAYQLRRRPLVAFGIFFYYLAHAVESSLIPIRDVIFEHRTYLLLVVQIPQWLNSHLTPVIMMSLTMSLLLILGTTTWQRNQKWRDPVALWQHNVEQSPEKKRGWIILGKHLVQRGQLEKAQGHTKHL